MSRTKILSFLVDSCTVLPFDTFLRAIKARCHVNFADVHQDARTHGDPWGSIQGGEKC